MASAVLSHSQLGSAVCSCCASPNHALFGLLHVWLQLSLVNSSLPYMSPSADDNCSTVTEKAWFSIRQVG
jgi:hypothetical protein